MTVYKKLMEARLKLMAVEMKKSGHNKFAGYNYFELGDFLPHIQRIFSEVGLCGVISFNQDIATLTIKNTDGEGEIVLTSPMASAELKGCHPVQNLGATQTYIRRYLWVSALEIVEHDAIDSTTGSEDVSKTPLTIKSPDGKVLLESNTTKKVIDTFTTISDKILNQASIANPDKIEKLKAFWSVNSDTIEMLGAQNKMALLSQHVTRMANLKNE